jgi:hypothetical protein
MNRGEMSPDVEETRQKYGDRLEDLAVKREELKRKEDNAKVQDVNGEI